MSLPGLNAAACPCLEGDPLRSASVRRPLVERALAGDAEALADLCGSRVVLVYSYLGAWTGSRATAERLTTEVFDELPAWLHPIRRGDQELGAVLVMLARAAAARAPQPPGRGGAGAGQRPAVAGGERPDVGFSGPARPGPTPRSQAVWPGEVLESLALLPDPQREVLNLRLVLGHSLEHTAHLIGARRRGTLALQLAACTSLWNLTTSGHGGEPAARPGEAEATAETFESRLDGWTVDQADQDPVLANALAAANALRLAAPALPILPSPGFVGRLRRRLLAGPAADAPAAALVAPRPAPPGRPAAQGPPALPAGGEAALPAGGEAALPAGGEAALVPVGGAGLPPAGEGEPGPPPAGQPGLPPGGVGGGSPGGAGDAPPDDPLGLVAGGVAAAVPPPDPRDAGWLSGLDGLRAGMDAAGERRSPAAALGERLRQFRDHRAALVMTALGVALLGGVLIAVGVRSNCPTAACPASRTGTAGGLVAPSGSGGGPASTLAAATSTTGTTAVALAPTTSQRGTTTTSSLAPTTTRLPTTTTTTRPPATTRVATTATTRPPTTRPPTTRPPTTTRPPPTTRPPVTTLPATTTTTAR